jgi:acyl carrier protein
MERNAIIFKLTEIFRNVFNNENLVLRDDMTASHVENWNSLSHMILITEIENSFNVKFKLKEVNKMRNVGDMIDILIQKI